MDTKTKKMYDFIKMIADLKLEEEPCADLFTEDDEQTVTVDDYAGGNIDDAFALGMDRGTWETTKELKEKAKQLLDSL